ncbi:uncharacterized protein METZ01_LOCUS101919 [marine metagenome]|uniref:Uncharacterized protein n=1 Tax=marine metagenome TaxID=408172 RepID=A0A381W991_9ZZZZ
MRYLVKTIAGRYRTDLNLLKENVVV